MLMRGKRKTRTGNIVNIIKFASRAMLIGGSREHFPPRKSRGLRDNYLKRKKELLELRKKKRKVVDTKDDSCVCENKDCGHDHASLRPGGESAGGSEGGQGVPVDKSSHPPAGEEHQSQGG